MCLLGNVWLLLSPMNWPTNGLAIWSQWTGGRTYGWTKVSLPTSSSLELITWFPIHTQFPHQIIKNHCNNNNIYAISIQEFLIALWFRWFQYNNGKNVSIVTEWDIFSCGMQAEPSYEMFQQIVTDDVQDVMVLDALESSHPISVVVNHPDEINELFDRISYGKG